MTVAVPERGRGRTIFRARTTAVCGGTVARPLLQQWLEKLGERHPREKITFREGTCLELGLPQRKEEELGHREGAVCSAATPFAWLDSAGAYPSSLP